VFERERKECPERVTKDAANLGKKLLTESSRTTRQLFPTETGIGGAGLNGREEKKPVGVGTPQDKYWEISKKEQENSGKKKKKSLARLGGAASRGT